MSKTTALKTELQRLLKTITTRVFFEQALDTATYPYIVYELNELFTNDAKTTMQLEINVLDYGTSTTSAENLTDNVQQALNKYRFINNQIQFATYKGLRRTVKEDDKKIIRRRLLFEIQLHELKGE